MHFKRIVDESYPCTYNTWKTEDATMVIQDLSPEDDEAALKILRVHMINDEILCSLQSKFLAFEFIHKHCGMRVMATYLGIVRLSQGD